MAQSSEEYDYAFDSRSSIRSSSLDEYIQSLSNAATGEGFRKKDYYILAISGVVIPALLLIWGAL